MEAGNQSAVCKATVRSGGVDVLHSDASEDATVVCGLRRSREITVQPCPTPPCRGSMPAHPAAAGERRRRGKSDRRATEITKAIRNTLEQTIMTELLPRSQIDIYVQVRAPAEGSGMIQGP